MTALSPEEGAIRLYRLLYDCDPEPVAKGRRGRPPAQQPLPYRHKLIGVMSIEEIRERARVEKEREAASTIQRSQPPKIEEGGALPRSDQPGVTREKGGAAMMMESELSELGIGQVEEPMKTLSGTRKRGRIITCIACGKEKEHLARMMCKHCYWKWDQARKREKKKHSIDCGESGAMVEAGREPAGATEKKT